MISSEIVHCLNGLGVVKKEQRDTINMTKFERTSSSPTYCFNIFFLFFLYEPLTMSLYDVVADYSWSY